MPGIVLTPSPERTLRYIKPSTQNLNEGITLTKTREYFNGSCFLVSKYLMAGPDAKNLSFLSKIKDTVDKNDKLCLIPFWDLCPEDLLSKESLDTKLPEVIVDVNEQKTSDKIRSCSKECIQKIRNGKKYFIDLDPKIHCSLLNVFCEFKHSSKNQIIDKSILCQEGVSLFDFYFKERIFVCKTLVKIKNYWFIEFY